MFRVSKACNRGFEAWQGLDDARNSGVDDVSRLQGCEMKAEGL
jgi:hypothetical protein